MRLPVQGLLLLASLSACPAHLSSREQRVSAGQLGCAPEEIEIRDRRFGRLWVAECRGRAYQCSPVSGNMLHMRDSQVAAVAKFRVLVDAVLREGDGGSFDSTEGSDGTSL